MNAFDWVNVMPHMLDQLLYTLVFGVRLKGALIGVAAPALVD